MNMNENNKTINDVTADLLQSEKEFSSDFKKIRKATAKQVLRHLDENLRHTITASIHQLNIECYEGLSHEQQENLTDYCLAAAKASDAAASTLFAWKNPRYWVDAGVKAVLTGAAVVGASLLQGTVTDYLAERKSASKELASNPFADAAPESTRVTKRVRHESSLSAVN